MNQLPPPMRIIFLSLFVCLSVSNFAQKTSKRICVKFSGKVGDGSVNKRLNFGGHPDRSLDTGIVFGFVTIGRYGKWLTDINLLLILIRQTAALVRRALAKVCTVPELLVRDRVAYKLGVMLSKCVRGQAPL